MKKIDFVEAGIEQIKVRQVLNKAFQQINEITAEREEKEQSSFAIGDIVIVEDQRYSYSGYYSFFSENNIPIGVAARFRYFQQPEFNKIYRVIATGTSSTEETVYCIEGYDSGKSVYLVAAKAINKIGTADENYKPDTTYDFVSVVDKFDK